MAPPPRGVIRPRHWGNATRKQAKAGFRPSTKVVLVAVLLIGALWGLAFAFTGGSGAGPSDSIRGDARQIRSLADDEEDAEEDEEGGHSAASSEYGGGSDDDEEEEEEGGGAFAEREEEEEEEEESRGGPALRGGGGSSLASGAAKAVFSLERYLANFERGVVKLDDSPSSYSSFKYVLAEAEDSEGARTLMVQSCPRGMASSQCLHPDAFKVLRK